MGVDILNVNFIGFYFVVFFFSFAAAESKGPVLEVVSIYNDNFTTPPSRDPYFIEVYCCVGGYFSEMDKKTEYSVECESRSEKAVQENYTPIEIVVPDSDNRNTFYKYVVYNHTSCKCASFTEERKLNGKDEKVSKTYFRNHSCHNPINLRNKRGFCGTAQPRYRQHKNSHQLTLQTRYYLQHQCLPGCWNKSSVVKKVPITRPGGKDEEFVFRSDTKCEAYAQSDQPCSQTMSGNAQQSTGVPQRLLGNNGSSNGQMTEVHTPGVHKAHCLLLTSDVSTSEKPKHESNDKLIISIGSTRMFLAALVLSFVLFIILILDFGLWRGKKGFFTLCVAVLLGIKPKTLVVIIMKEELMKLRHKLSDLITRKKTRLVMK